MVTGVDSVNIMPDMKAFILAAGVSRRLYPHTYDVPKCLLDVGGKPIIHYQLEALKSLGILDITMVVGYHREMLTNHVKHGSSSRIKLPDLINFSRFSAA